MLYNCKGKRARLNEKANSLRSLWFRLVFEQIAELAIEYKAGARSLRGIFEEMMTDVLYAIPDHPGIRQVVITSLFEPPQLLSSPQGDFLRGAVNPEK